MSITETDGTYYDWSSGSPVLTAGGPRSHGPARRDAERLVYCAICGFPVPISQTVVQKGLRRCRRDVDRYPSGLNELMKKLF